ncbi:hypothetical protein NQ318_017579 [Aromia moschata]|uniref:Chitin-binding type-2 domain-containing protein n=1 Tax=Aromia moschata TaxID=1265417 RepID=A0AAV8Z0M3_9CUCU|nr:hypothetical protein NQ318_017579 [Aromia moschata]
MAKLATQTRAHLLTAPSSCTSAGVYEASNCNQYYECVYVMWWYELVLQTCSSGEAFDSSTGTCVTDSTCSS